jgi:LuxR family maltose regulon positive regulatory protein
LQCADRLSEVLLNRKCYEDTIQLCQRILSQDNCWERAYRHLMLAYDGMGDHGQIGRVYQRCVQVLAQELEVPPSAETHELFLQLTQRA